MNKNTPTQLDDAFFDSLLIEAGNSDRKRAHHNLHQAFDEPVQRLCIALRKGTYVRPHHHELHNKWELMLGLKGRLGLVLFDHSGAVINKFFLGPGGTTAGFEIPPNTWHAVYADTDDVVILEIKEGPYTPAKESDFASWAPKEGDAEVGNFLCWLQEAEVGDSYTSS